MVYRYRYANDDGQQGVGGVYRSGEPLAERLKLKSKGGPGWRSVNPVFGFDFGLLRQGNKPKLSVFSAHRFWQLTPQLLGYRYFSSYDTVALHTLRDTYAQTQTHAFAHSTSNFVICDFRFGIWFLIWNYFNFTFSLACCRICFVAFGPRVSIVSFCGSLPKSFENVVFRFNSKKGWTKLHLHLPKKSDIPVGLWEFLVCASLTELLVSC